MKGYCKHLYDETTEGYIQLLKINNDKTVNIYNSTYGNLKKVVGEIEGNTNIYVTPNTTYIPKRKVDNIRQLRALYIDIDSIEDDKNYIFYKLFELAENEIIPKPSMIVDSGRGFHLYWKIKDAPIGALKTWQVLEDYLYKSLKEFGADARATDAVRVLRLPGTINSKNGKECKIVYSDDNLEYSMYDLREKYLKYKKVEPKKDSKKVIVNSFFNSYSLHSTRAYDLETLCSLRSYDLKDYRNMIIHCYAYWKGIYIRDIQELEEVVTELNNKFKEPLKDSEIKAILRSIPKAIESFIDYQQAKQLGQVYKGKQVGYSYKNETLIDRLNITLEEQKHLKTIISKEEKYRRNNLKRTPRNENGLTNKQQELQELRIKVLELKDQGLSNVKIAEILRTNESKIRRLLKL